LVFQQNKRNKNKNKNLDIRLVSEGDTVNAMHDVEFATMASHEGMTRETNANGNFLKSLKCIAFKRDSVAYYSSDIDINISKGCSDDTSVDDNSPFFSFLVDENTPIFGIH